MRDLSHLKICFLAGTLEHGGAERQLYYMLQVLRQGGAIPRVLSLDRGEFWEQRIQTLGIEVTWTGQRQSRLSRLIRVLKELHKNPPDILQSQHFFANSYVGLVARLTRCRGIGAMRNEGNSELLRNGLVGGWLNLHLPAIIAANSRLAIEQAIAKGVPASRLFFLPNVIDMQTFKPPSHVKDGPVTLLAVGRVARQKRFDRFISILGRLRRDLNLPVRGLIVGPVQDQGLFTALEAQARKLGLLPDSVQFLGGVSDMTPLYRQSAVCVLTSDYEGTPNVLLEAMACGLPAVSSNVGGIPMIIQDGKTGFLLHRENLEGFVMALAELIRNNSLRRDMGCRARKYITENHSIQRLPGYLRDLYRMALPPRSHWKPLLIENPQS